MTRSLMSQLSDGRGGDNSVCEFDRVPRTHCAFASTSSSIGDSSQILSFGMSTKESEELSIEKVSNVEMNLLDDCRGSKSYWIRAP